MQHSLQSCTAGADQTKQIALQLSTMDDAELYNWILGGSNRTGSKRLEWLRDIIKKVADE